MNSVPHHVQARPLDDVPRMPTFCGRMFASHHQPDSRGPCFRRFIAAGAVCVVLLLGASAASPGLHHYLHGDGADDAGADNCAIVLFASGVTLAFGAIAVLAPTVAWRPASPRIAQNLFVVSPRFLRQPERGPPQS